MRNREKVRLNRHKLNSPRARRKILSYRRSLVRRKLPHTWSSLYGFSFCVKVDAEKTMSTLAQIQKRVMDIADTIDLNKQI